MNDDPFATVASARAARRRARLAFAAGLLLLALWVLRSFLVVLAWTVIVGITLWPLYERFRERFREARGRRWLAPLAFTLIASVALVLPLAIAAYYASYETRLALAWFAQIDENGLPAPPWLEQLPLAGAGAAAWWQGHLGAPHGPGALLGGVDKQSLADLTRRFGAQLLNRAAVFSLTMMALFLLFRDGDALAARVQDLADRWLGEPGERLADKMAETVRGTVNGTLLVALGEAALISVGYVVAGVPQPALFGVATAMCAMFPLGAWFAFATASLVLLSLGSALGAAGLSVFGAVVMLVGDYFVQPVLVGNAVRMPFLWVLLGVLGGVETFGLVGLFLGPVILAAVLKIWRDWPTTLPPEEAAP